MDIEGGLSKIEGEMENIEVDELKKADGGGDDIDNVGDDQDIAEEEDEEDNEDGDGVEDDDVEEVAETGIGVEHGTNKEGDNELEDENGDEEGRNGDEEDSSSRRWNTRADTFDDFRFKDEDRQESNASLPELPEAKLAGLWGDGDKVLTAKINKDRRFVCVDYPGIVKNLDKAIETMDGYDNISQILSENGRMAVLFRPQDPYCKPVYSNCIFSQHLLVRVRRRKKKHRDKEPEPGPSTSGATADASVLEAEADPYEYQLVVEGIVDKMYKFDQMCDFQYLPIKRNGQPESRVANTTSSTPNYTEILSRIVPSPETKRHEYLKREVPLFLPPIVFSRRCIPVAFNFENDMSDMHKSHIIDTERKKRSIGTLHLTFEHPGVPTEPHPEGSLSLDKLPRGQRESGLQAVKKMFEDRPLWSKAGLQVNLEPTLRRYLTYILPMVAYYITNGPWKSLWCRFGYDARKDPSAKIYQIVDFRLRKLLNRDDFEGKRELWSKGMVKLSQGGPNVNKLADSPNVQYLTNVNATYAAKQNKHAKELVYVYRMDHLPPYRQMRYQVCDIHHPAIQALTHQNDGKEQECTERDGWCIPDFTDMCRDILHDTVMKLQEKLTEGKKALTDEGENDREDLEPV